jgi:hypothetical protein
MTHLDGNAVAGALSEIFALDVTVAIGQCDGCGRRAPLADTRVYAQAPGFVVRCPSCESVLFRLVGAPGRVWLDLRGLTSVELRTDLP